MMGFIGFLKENKILVGVGYVVFMLLFFFIGVPRAGFGTYVVAFLLLTGFYAFLVYVLGKMLEKY